MLITTNIILLNKTNPKPKCAVTRSACSFSLITMAPNAICPTTAAEAIIENIFVVLVEFFPFSTKAIVRNTKSPVVAAIVLCTYSIRNSYEGVNPCGHKGQSGQDRPTPVELTYPPRVISPNRTHKVPIEKT